MNVTHDTKDNDYLNSLLAKHNVQGVSIARLDGGNTITTLCAGFSNRDEKILMTSDTWLQQASLSKTIAAAFTVSFYQQQNIPLSTRVIDLLARLQSPFILDVAGPEVPKEWLAELQLFHLINHTVNLLFLYSQ